MALAVASTAFISAKEDGETACGTHPGYATPDSREMAIEINFGC